MLPNVSVFISVLFFIKLFRSDVLPSPPLYISITLSSPSSYSSSSTATLCLLKGCDQSILLYIGSASDKRSFSMDFSPTVIFSLRFVFVFVFFNSFLSSSYCLDIVLLFFFFFKRRLCRNFCLPLNVLAVGNDVSILLSNINSSLFQFVPVCCFFFYRRTYLDCLQFGTIPLLSVL